MKPEQKRVNLVSLARRLFARIGVEVAVPRPSRILPCPLCGSRAIEALADRLSCDDCGHEAHDASEDAVAQWNEEARQR